MAAYLQVAAPFHGFQHGYFVGIFQVGADGDADANPRNADAERLKELGF